MSISSSEKINGSWNTGSKNAQSRLDGPEQMAKSTAKIYFRPNLPDFAWGLNHLDIDHHANARVKTSIGRIKSDSFEVSVGTWADSTLYGAGVTYLDIYDYDRELQHGSFDTNELHISSSSSPRAQKQNSKRFEFTHPFSAPPSVIVWLTGFDIDKVCDIRIRAYATDITPTGFTCHIDSWGDTLMYWASAHWIAHPVESPRICSGVYSTNGDNVGPYVPPQPTPRISVRKASTSSTHIKPANTTAPKIKLGDGSLSSRGSVTFPEGKFTSTPRVSAGINMINFSAQTNARVSIVEDNISPEGFDWGLNTWGDSRMKAAGASYIAIDEGPGSMLQKTRRSTRSSKWDDATSCGRSSRRSEVSIEEQPISSNATITAASPGKQRANRSNSTRSHATDTTSASLKPRPNKQSQRYSEETKSTSYLPLSSPSYLENLSRASLPASAHRDSQHTRDPSVPRSVVPIPPFSPPATSPTYGKRRKNSAERIQNKMEDVLLGISSNDLLHHQMAGPAGHSDSGLHIANKRASLMRPSHDEQESERPHEPSSWKSGWKLRMKMKKPIFQLHASN